MDSLHTDEIGRAVGLPSELGGLAPGPAAGTGGLTQASSRAGLSP